MGFLRVSASADGKLKQPLRAGAGFISNVSPTLFDTEVDTTLTVAQISGGAVIQGGILTSIVNYTLPASLDIVAEWPTMDVGDAFTFYVGNAQPAALDVIILMGTGTTLRTNTNRVGPKSGRMFTLIKTSDTTHDLC